MNKRWNAVILAGDRGPGDPVASFVDKPGKAFAPLNGQSLIERMISVLVECDSIDKVFAVGPNQKYLTDYPSIRSHLQRHRVEHIEPGKGPSASALQGVLESNQYPTLIVTCDLALLNSSVIDDYCKSMQNVNADFVACAVEHHNIKALIPELKKTQYQFAGRVVCFANVFAVLSPQGLKALEFWQDVEESRKNPIQLIRKIDWLSLLSYKLGRLSLDQVAKKLSLKVDAELVIESMSHPELAIDVDSASDYNLIQRYLQS